MREPSRTFVEAALALAFALGVGFAANALHPEGLSFGRDYFMARDPVGPPRQVPRDGADAADPTAPPARTTPSAGAPPPADPVRARLEAQGLQVIDHDEVVRLFEDELYEAGAYVFVDARNADAYAEGHIPGAWNHDHYRYERTVDEVMQAGNGAVKVVVYCHGQDCTDSELAARQLIQFGLDPSTVFVYPGGILRWKEAGLALVQGEERS